MVQTSPFELLPVELVQAILLWACKGRLEDAQEVSDNSYDNGNGVSRVATYSNFFALAQISSRSRSFALAHRPIFRCLAEYLTKFCPTYGEEDKAKRLLKYCSKQSADSLSHIDLAGFIEMDRCVKRQKKMVAIVARSVTSLKELHIDQVGAKRPGTCDCHPEDPDHVDYDDDGFPIDWDGDSRDEDDDRAQSVVDSWPTVNKEAFSLLRSASSLKQLSIKLGNILHLNEALKDGSIAADKIKARPTTLKIEDGIWRGLPSAKLAALFGKLASQTSHFYYSTPRPECPTDLATNLAYSVVHAASVSLVELHLQGAEQDLALESLLRLSLPHVEKLCIRTRAGRQRGFTEHQRLDPSQKTCVPALKSFEGEAWVLDRLDAPSLGTLVVRRIDVTRDEPVLLDCLGRGFKIKDLMFQCRLARPIGAMSRLLRNIFKALTPSDEACLCPALQRISVLSHHMERYIRADTTWLVDEGFTNPYDPSIRIASVSGRGDYVAIGRALVELDKKRFEFSRSSSAAEPICKPLKTIRLMYVLMDPAAWELLLQTSQCENRWCYPDPLTEANKTQYQSQFEKYHRKALEEES